MNFCSLDCKSNAHIGNSQIMRTGKLLHHHHCFHITRAQRDSSFSLWDWPVIKWKPETNWNLDMITGRVLFCLSTLHIHIMQVRRCLNTFVDVLALIGPKFWRENQLEVPSRRHCNLYPHSHPGSYACKNNWMLGSLEWAFLIASRSFHFDSQLLCKLCSLEFTWQLAKTLNNSSSRVHHYIRNLNHSARLYSSSAFLKKVYSKLSHFVTFWVYSNLLLAAIHKKIFLYSSPCSLYPQCNLRTYVCKWKSVPGSPGRAPMVTYVHSY